MRQPLVRAIELAIKNRNREAQMKAQANLLKVGALLGGILLAALPVIAAAQEEGGTKTARELRASYDKAVRGKTIAFLPIALGIPLQDEWGRVVQTEAEWRG